MKPANTAIYPLTLYYDAACPVCALEMDHLRERNHKGLLQFVDISTTGFDPVEHGASLEAMNAVIHARCADGSMLKGVEVLRLAYDAAGLGWVTRSTGWPLVRPLADVAYRAFARHRYVISRTCSPLIGAVRGWRAQHALARMERCHSGACEMHRRTDHHGVPSAAEADKETSPGRSS